MGTAVILFALALLAPQGAPASGESPEVVFQKAKVLFQEQGKPAEAILLLARKVLSRPGIDTADFERALALVRLFAGKEKKKGSPLQERPKLLPDLKKLIQREIDAYLSGKVKKPERIRWYGKAALPLVLQRMKRDFYLPGVVEKLAPLVLGSGDDQACLDFLSWLKEKGDLKLIDVVVKGGIFYLRTGKNSWTQNPVGQKTAAFLHSWFAQAPDPVAARLMKAMYVDLDPEEWIRTFDRDLEPWGGLEKKINNFCRFQPKTLQDPNPFFQAALKYFKIPKGKLNSFMAPSKVYRWILAQKGGFDILCRAVALSGIPVSPKNLDRLSSMPTIPTPQEALESLKPVWARRETRENTGKIFTRLLLLWPEDRIKEAFQAVPVSWIEDQNFLEDLKPFFGKGGEGAALIGMEELLRRELNAPREKRGTILKYLPLFLFWRNGFFKESRTLAYLLLAKEIRADPGNPNCYSPLPNILRKYPPSSEALTALARTFSETARLLSRKQKDASRSRFAMAKGALVLAARKVLPEKGSEVIRNLLPLPGFLVPFKNGILQEDFSYGADSIGVESIFLYSKATGKPLLEFEFTMDQKKTLFQAALREGEASRMAYLFSGPSNFERRGLFLPSSEREALGPLLLRDAKALLKIIHGRLERVYYVTFLPWETIPFAEAKERILKLITALQESPWDPFGHAREMLFLPLLRITPDLKKLISELPALPVQVEPSWLFNSTGGVRWNEESFYSALSWLEKADPSWPDHLDLTSYFARFPSPRGKPYLARMLLSKNGKIRAGARQVLDDWARLEGVKKEAEARTLKAKLLERVGPDKPLPVRIAALQGLFDLGEKRAWLLLTDWLESKDPKLRAAAEKLSNRVQLRR